MGVPLPVSNQDPGSFLSAVHEGKNQWWRYLLSVALIGFIFYSLTGILGGVALALGWLQLGSNGSVQIEDPLLSYGLTHLPFGFWMLGLGLVVRHLHRRRWGTLVRSDGSLRWRRMAQGAGVWWLLMAGPLALSLLLHPAALNVEVDWGLWIRLLGLAVVLTPIQIAAEELFFRGYLLQASGLLTRNPWILCGLNGILFMLAHLDNPEMGYGWGWLALYYAGFGIFATYLTLNDQGLELALGMHAANNGFVILLVSYDDAVVETPALLQASGLDPVAVVLAFGIRALAFAWLFFRIPGPISGWDPSQTDRINPG